MFGETNRLVRNFVLEIFHTNQACCSFACWNKLNRGQMINAGINDQAARMLVVFTHLNYNINKKSYKLCQYALEFYFFYTTALFITATKEINVYLFCIFISVDFN